MANPAVSLPTRTSIDAVSGVTRQSFPGQFQKSGGRYGDTFSFCGRFLLNLPCTDKDDTAESRKYHCSLSDTLSRSASQALLPRLAGEVDPLQGGGPASPVGGGAARTSMGGGTAGTSELNESAVLTEELVGRFRRSIWPPPSIQVRTWKISLG